MTDYLPDLQVELTAKLLEIAADLHVLGEPLLASRVADLAFPDLDRTARKRVRRMFRKLRPRRARRRKYICCREFGNMPLRARGGRRTWATTCKVRIGGKEKWISRFVTRYPRPRSIVYRGKKIRTCPKEMFQDQKEK